MAEKIFTIPINESMDMYDGCPICRLKSKLEDTTVAYALGAAMMEPDVRIEMNRLGFCARHFDAMFASKNKLALALILESHLDQVSGIFGAPADGSKGGLFKKSKPGKDASETCAELSQSCFICGKMGGTERRYYSNVAYLWEKDDGFRDKFKKQPYFCVTHAAGILKAGKNELKAADYQSLYTALTDIMRAYTDSLRNDISKFCRSFDYRNSSEPLGDEKYGIEKAIKLLR